MIPDYLYKWIYLILCTLLCLSHNTILASYKGNNAISRFGYSTKNVSIALLLFMIVFIGTRPLSKYFTDMYYYAGFYDLKAFDSYDSSSGEFLWVGFQKICYYWFGMPSLTWLFLIAFLSLLLKYLACKRIFHKNVYTAYLFVVTSFYFWGAVTNVVRSDMAFSLALYGMTVTLNEKSSQKYVVTLLFFFLALFTHKSSVLLIISFLSSYIFVKDVRWAILFWILCVIMSLVNPTFFESLFIGMGFDDRVEKYLTGEDSIGVFSHSGFRWDFLLYSMVPIVLGWFISKKSEDRTYTALLNTYIVANGFWVLVIRALFSDRFAGISWSIYGFVLALSLIKLDASKKHSRYIAIGLIGQLLFLWIMQIFFY